MIENDAYDKGWIAREKSGSWSGVYGGAGKNPYHGFSRNFDEFQEGWHDCNDSHYDRESETYND